MAAYCVLGASIGLSQGASPIVAIVTGILTATFGGILRDVLSKEESVLLRDEIYITCALLGASLFVLFMHFELPRSGAIIAGISSAFSLRAGALFYGWTMPRYKAKKGRKSPR